MVLSFHLLFSDILYLPVTPVWVSGHATRKLNQTSFTVMEPGRSEVYSNPHLPDSDQPDCRPKRKAEQLSNWFLNHQHESCHSKLVTFALFDSVYSADFGIWPGIPWTWHMQDGDKMPVLLECWNKFSLKLPYGETTELPMLYFCWALLSNALYCRCHRLELDMMARRIRFVYWYFRRWWFLCN